MPDLLLEQIKHIDAIQFLVLIFGILEVLLARANKILLYPAGIIATTLSVYSLFHAQLYAECMLSIYYIVMSIYGWWYWVRKKNEPPVRITYSTKQEWITTLSITLGGSILLYFILASFTPSNVPLWDAGVSATAWAGMWLLARRKIENWILLNLSNAFAIPLLFVKGLPLLALLTIFLFIVACVGYLDWAKIYRRENKHQSLTGEPC